MGMGHEPTLDAPPDSSDDDDARNRHTPEAFASTEMGVGPKVPSRRPASEDGPDPMIGRVLSGLYKVEDRIGEGGMGTVYMAMHIHLNKAFAVKVLSPNIANNRQAVERFKQEATAASQIDHENIVNVVNFDSTDDGEVFIVMELLRGRSLAEMLEDGPMSLERALPVTYQICRALSAAHERGIVHRDLKPENVFMVRKGDRDFAKVLDFGISKVRTAEAEQVRVTKTGQLVGTPLYMSPEQAKGEADIDKRADVYALGVMLYEMLTGTPPFEGGNYFQLLWKHGNEPPQPPRSRAPEAEIPTGVEKAILKALEKAPEDRFEDMAAFEAALVAGAPEVGMPDRLYSLTPSSPSLAPAVPRPSTSPWAIAVGAAVLIGLGALGAMAIGGDGETARAPDPPVRTANPPPSDPTPPTPAPPDPTPEVVPQGVEPPAEVAVRLDSHPQGATVFHGERELCQTPCEVPLLPSEAPVEVRFVRAGFVDAVERVTPREGAIVFGRLRPRTRNPPPGTSSPIKMDF